MKETGRIVPEYCDCGHLRTFHLEWIDQNQNPHCKCFGTDTELYHRTAGNMDFDPNDTLYNAPLYEKDVKCKCTMVTI